MGASGGRVTKIKPVKAFTISRKVWLRGEPNDSFLLRNRDGKMCCVGIFLHACGVPAEEMLDGEAVNSFIGLPIYNRMEQALGKSFGWLFRLSVKSSLIDRLYHANDNSASSISPNTREKRIAELFAEGGVEVTFKD